MEEVISEHNAHCFVPPTRQWLKKYTTQMNRLQSDMIDTANLDLVDKFSPTTTADEFQNLNPAALRVLKSPLMQRTIFD